EAAGLAAIAARFVRTLELGGAPAVVALGAVLFGGYLTMFTGLLKPASELCLVTAALATLGVAAVRNGRGFLACGVTLAAALLLHRSAIVLIPTWIAVWVLWLRRPRARSAWRNPSTWLALSLPCLA